jgi:hypothetical protein
MENWTWGLSLIALTVGFHVSGVVFMALVLHSIGGSRGKPEPWVAASVRDLDWPDWHGRIAAGGTTRD